MPTFRVQHAFHGYGGGSKDMYVNTFHLWSATQTMTENNGAFSEPRGNAVVDLINGFYTSTNSVGQSIWEYMSPRVSAGDQTVKIYDLANAPHSGPVYQEVNPVGGSIPQVQGLPEEVAICLSYKANDSGANIKRRRGRIYLGPFSMAAIDDVQGVYQPVRVVEALRNAITGAAQVLKTGLEANGWKWRVWSVTDNLGFDITQVWVDDAFDTVRGRGTAPAVRSVLALT